DKRQNVTQCCVLRALGKLCVFRCRKLSLEPIKQPIQHEPLALVDRNTDRNTRDIFPKSCLREDGAESGLGALNGASETAEKPFHPGCNVQCPLLRFLKNAVIGSALLPDLRRHAVE